MMEDNNILFTTATAATTTTVDWSDHTNESSIFDPTYTYSNDKYSCIIEFWYFHMILNYVIFGSGLVCLLTRLPSLNYKKVLHAWCGRIYILSMLWSTCSSLLINNEGLPVAVLVSFAAVMGGLTIGWIVIIIHQQTMKTQATQIVQTKIIDQLRRNQNENNNLIDTTVENNNKENNNVHEDVDLVNLNTMMTEATMEIVNSKTFVQRFFSFKSLHGILFFVSWMQIAGRIFNSGDGEFSCRSYPVYKPIDAPHIPDDVDDMDRPNNTLHLMPVHDPHWDELPWSNGPVIWALLIIVASALLAIIGGILLSLFFTWKSKREATKVATSMVKEDRIIKPTNPTPSKVEEDNEEQKLNLEEKETEQEEIHDYTVDENIITNRA